MNLGWDWDTIQPITNSKGFGLLNAFGIIELRGITEVVVIPPPWSWPLLLGVQVIMMSVSYV